MSRTTLLIAILMVTASAQHFEKLFTGIATTEESQTLVDSVLLQIQAGSDTDTLISMIRDVTKGLKEQMKDAKNVAEDKHDECDRDQKDLSREIFSANGRYAKADGLSFADSKTLATRQQEFKNKKRELHDRQAMLGVLQEQRDAEREKQQRLTGEYRSVFDALDQCRLVINEKLVASDDLFLQTGTSMQAGIMRVLRDFKTAENGVTHAYGHFFKLLFRIMEHSQKEWGTQADQTIVDRLLAILDRIQENLEMAEATERSAEFLRQRDFDQLSQKLGNLILGVTIQMSELNAVMFTLESRIAQCEDAKQQAVDAYTDLNTRLGDRQNECDTEQQIWEQFYQNMSAQLSTAGKVMYLLEDKRALLARYGL